MNARAFKDISGPAVLDIQIKKDLYKHDFTIQ
jgi:hypothetical protein